MRKFITSLPQWVEIALVSVLAFGFFAFVSLSYVVRPKVQAHFDDSGFLNLMLVQLGLLAVIALFLWLRGWTLRKIGLSLWLNDLPIGVLLGFGALVAWVAIYIVTAMLAPGLAQGMSDTSSGLIEHHLNWWIVIPAIVVNPFFEELFETGYIVTALKRDDNPWFAVNVSVAIRLVCHLYQGPLGVLSILPPGLIFGYWFARTGRLWPCIAGHILVDLLAVLQYA